MITIYFIENYIIDKKVKEDLLKVNEFNKEVRERAARLEKEEKEHRDWLKKQDNKNKKTK